MFQLSEWIYSILNIPAITAIAVDGVSPMIAEQEAKHFVNYTFGSTDTLSKDKRVQVTVKVECYSSSYNNTLKMYDQVDEVMKSVNASLVDFDSEYLLEDDRCAVYAVYNIRKTI